jgi:hypothetical protein
MRPRKRQKQETRDRENETTIFPKRKTARRKSRNVVQSGQAALAFEEAQVSASCLDRKRTPTVIAVATIDFGHGVHIFTDGACEPNPGPGGWGFVVYSDGVKIHSDSGFASKSTNNRMEMLQQARCCDPRRPTIRRPIPAAR